MKKIYIMVIAILLIILIIVYGLFFLNKGYTYQDDYNPGEKYIIKINPITKVLKGTFKHYCSAANCDTTFNTYQVTLTKDEYNKINKIWNDRANLSPILELICKDDEIFYESYETSYEETEEDYNIMDTNNDGKITNREFANTWLNQVINGE